MFYHIIRKIVKQINKNKTNRINKLNLVTIKKVIIN